MPISYVYVLHVICLYYRVLVACTFVFHSPFLQSIILLFFCRIICLFASYLTYNLCAQTNTVYSIMLALRPIVGNCITSCVLYTNTLFTLGLGFKKKASQFQLYNTPASQADLYFYYGKNTVFFLSTILYNLFT